MTDFPVQIAILATSPIAQNLEDSDMDITFAIVAQLALLLLTGSVPLLFLLSRPTALD